MITIDDRDTILVQDSFTNSFNSDHDVTVIDDSFNAVDISDDDVTNDTDVDIQRRRHRSPRAPSSPRRTTTS